MSTQAPVPQLTEVKRGQQDWRFVRGGVPVDMIDDVTHHVQMQTERTLWGDPRFRRAARTEVDQQVSARIPSVVSHTFEVVALRLLEGNQHILKPEYGNAIHAAVLKRVNAELDAEGHRTWLDKLPCKGRVLKIAVKVAVSLALGWLRVQFPVVTLARIGLVATTLQSLVDRKPVE